MSNDYTQGSQLEMKIVLVKLLCTMQVINSIPKEWYHLILELCAVIIVCK